MRDFSHRYVVRTSVYTLTNKRYGVAFSVRDGYTMKNNFEE